jgi:hypothetical protein
MEYISLFCPPAVACRRLPSPGGSLSAPIRAYPRLSAPILGRLLSPACAPILAWWAPGGRLVGAWWAPVLAWWEPIRAYPRLSAPILAYPRLSSAAYPRLSSAACCRLPARLSSPGGRLVGAWWAPVLAWWAPILACLRACLRLVGASCA